MTTYEDARPLPGGPLSVELLNTRWHSATGLVDWLDHDEAVQLFAASHDVEIAPDQIDSTRSSLVEVRDLIQRLFQSANDSDISDALTTEVNATLQNADVRFAMSGDSPQIAITSDDTAQQLAIEAVVNAATLLGTRPGRIHSCEHDACTLWFLDTSKAGRRRWCSMERCGNRAKARRHYARSTQAQAP